MNTYFKQIDALRAWAVLTVVFGHMPVISGDNVRYLSELAHYLPGVPLFFCISGFLITLIIINNRNQDWKSFLKSFYARRFLRIFPIYYLTILVLFITMEAYRSWCLYDIFYVSNIKIGLMGSFNGVISAHFWSLAVEEQFYLFWPILLILFRRREFVLIGLVFVTAFLISHINDYSFLMIRTLVPVCYLSLGGMIAYLYFYYPQVIKKLKNITPWLILVGLILVGFISMDWIKISKIHFSLIFIPILLIQFIYGFENKLLKTVFENPLVIHIGKISYGIYLYHLFAIYPALQIKNMFHLSFLDNPQMMQIFKICLSILIASLSWTFFESRINKLKSHFSYSKN
ncbi:MAG: acyltransferase [Flavobacteriales bacterium]|nr:acyltransferase [Flavobacteriales bacterium]